MTIKNIRLLKHFLASFIVFIFSTQLTFADNNSNTNATFLSWLADFKAEAKAANISPQTIHKTLKGAKLLPRVIVFDRGQPEFITPFLSYVDRRVTPNQIALGRLLMQQHNVLLNNIEAQYGVPKNILIAFWGLETSYGQNKGNFGLPSSLMTLAYEGRRAAFFRSQLLDTMRIVDAGHNTVAGMRGSWAGAMGQMQFMPSTFIKYGVDADGDGRINMMSSLPDIFSSAANYLTKVGWRDNEAAAIEIKLPNNFDLSQAQLNNRKRSADWAKLGVLTIDNKALPDQENAAILLPQGWQGPVFMVFSNFDVIMDWNRSVNYGLSIVHLADQLVADNPIIAGELAEKQALTFNQMWALQEKLNVLGYACGEPDGFPGLKTQVAIRQYQVSQQLPPDGYASPSLTKRIMTP